MRGSLEGFVEPPTTTLPLCQLLVQSQHFLNRCKVQDAAVQRFQDQRKSLQTVPGFTVCLDVLTLQRKLFV